jgi:glycosylphosphatidylinositol transamidase (GPIT) subunit GPI8
MSKGVISEKAMRIAKRLGIEEDDIILLRFEDNILDIDVTVIAGSDYAGYVEKLNRAKEESL